MTAIANSSLGSYSYAYYATTQSSNGKVAVPVQSSEVMYTQLEHISGYVAPGKSSGVSINKVHLLNTLISKAMEVKSSKSTGTFLTAESFPVSKYDTLIFEYSSKIRSAISAAKTNPYAIAPMGLKGIAFDFTA